MIKELLLVGKKSVGRPRITEEEQKAFRLKISKTARQLFFKEGFESVSMRRIAKEVGCHPMSLYQYFESKHAILQKIWEVIFEELLGHCKKALEGNESPEYQLKAACSTFMHFWIDRPQYFKMVYLSSDPKTIALGEQVFVEGSAIEAIILLVKGLVCDCQKEGVLSHDKSDDEIIQLLYANMLGVILCITTIPEYPWMESNEYVEKTLDNILRGLAP